MRPVPIAAALALLAVLPAHAQYGGGGGRHRGGGGPSSEGGDGAPRQRGPIPANPAAEPMSQVEIVGVVQAIDPATDRITIAYEPVQALNWPAGVLPFVVSRSALLQGVSVGEKVRFKLDSQQISALRPF
jgi:Cu/Ag efflux protein CusF